jgi:peptidoglycan/LPS O-acetylase OafA/YrhL
MFGLVRTLWAAMVVIGHIFWVSDFGRFAVFGFYILSGYLMTYVMHNTYGFTTNSKLKFASNRFLRLYPAFWVTSILTVILLLIMGPSNNGKFEIIQLPNSLESTFSNATMLYLHWMPSLVTPRLSPATWALTVEIFFYTMIAIGASKTLLRTYFWVGLSLAYVLLSYIFGLYWHARYFSIPAGSLPFSLGALIYFLVRDKKSNFVPEAWIRNPFLLFLGMFCTAVFASFAITRGLSLWAMEILFYFSTLLSFLIVLSLAKGYILCKPLTKAWDKKIGDYSYPFYLLHYLAAAIASFWLLGRIDVFKADVTITSILVFFTILMFISTFIIKSIDHPIEKVRLRIKNRKNIDIKAI